MTSFFTRGLLIGFCLAVPVGPVGILCIRRTLHGGRLAGLVAGLGAAAADALYGAVAVSGFRLVADAFAAHESAVRVVGGLVLVALGVRAFLHKPAEDGATERGRGLAAAGASTFFLTLANPATLLVFGALFAGSGLGSARSNLAADATSVAGVFTGSALWWLILSSGVFHLHRRLRIRELGWLNIASGVILAGFGVLAICSTL